MDHTLMVMLGEYYRDRRIHWLTAVLPQVSVVQLGTEG